VDEEDELFIINSSSVVIRLKVDDISTMGRSTKGVKLMRIDERDSVISIAKVLETENEIETK